MTLEDRRVGQTVERQVISGGAAPCNTAGGRGKLCNAAEFEEPSEPPRLVGLAIQNDAAA